MSKKQRKHSASFKAQVAIEALKEQKTLSQLSSDFRLHPTQIRRWRDEARDRLPDIFTGKIGKELAEKEQLIEELYKQLGQKTVELDWLKKKLKPFFK